ncbi:hypothetical protein LCGC14_1541960 [marine sediment metagenome]|uniref:Uncharacterized protein n=1 Tax=marine sediment metagenome TaxID=412755 RepID=A0A0F9ISU3_9ZZZZ
MNPVPEFLNVTSPWIEEPVNRDDLRGFLANNGVEIEDTFEIHFEPKKMTVHYYLDSPRKLDKDGEIRTGSRTVIYLTSSIPKIITQAPSS